MLYTFLYFDKGKKLRSDYHKAVSKISRRWVNTTSKWGIKQLRISFGSIFLLFPYESSWPSHSQ